MSGPDPPELSIGLLGGFRVTCGESAVEESAWRLRKARGLLKLLALTPEHALHRERVIDALWPERDPDAASNNLRQALFVARRALDSCGDDGAARLELSQEMLTLHGDRLQIDVDAFEAAAAEAERDPSLERHLAAIELYGGELLPEDRFEEWAAPRRTALRERHLTLLVDLARLYEEAGDPAAAVTALQQALVDEPLHERAHRELMRIYALTGRRQRALAQFHLLRESLRREFADEPDDETRRLYQDILTRRLGADDAPARDSAPAARRADDTPRRAGNLPLQLTSFVGRGRELGEVIGLARRHRLLTLTGPGGCGKTRLALEGAAALLRDAPDGAWLVELAGLSDGALVPHAVAAALGVESRSARPSEDAVAAHVGDRQMLLILDNCEHLVGSCAELAEHLLSACPNLRILATSREPLHVPGEVDWRVPSLSPGEAARLFVDRASAVSSRFALTDENSEAVAEICRRVDGIPLAIELAAARVGVLAPAQIAERLRDSLTVLVGGSRTALTRQQTLVATLDWSHELLTDDEQILFRRLGVFASSFDLAAVEAICEGELDLLARLVDKSLVVVEEQAGAARYRLLDTMRHYARERMAEAGERPGLEERHREHYLALAEELEPLDTAAARRRLALEADELRAALRTALHDDADSALRLSAALWRFWHDRGDLVEGARWLDQTLAAAPRPSDTRARVLHGRSVLALRVSDSETAMATAHEAMRWFRESRDLRSLGEELHHLGAVAWVFADFEGSDRWCEESRAVAEQAGEPSILASVAHTAGVIAASRNDIETARELLAHSIDLLRTLPDDGRPVFLPVAAGYGRVPGDRGRRIPRLFLEQTFVTARRVAPEGAVPYALCDLALAARNAGDLAESRLLLDESLSRFRDSGDELGTAQALGLLGTLLATEGEHDLAREVHEESLALREAANNARGIGLSLVAMAAAAAAAGDYERGRQAAERAFALFDRTADEPGRGCSVMQLGLIAADSGRVEEARALQERALAIWSDFFPKIGWTSSILVELADLDLALGEPERAAERLRRALDVYLHIGDQSGVAYCEEMLQTLPNAALTPE